MPIRIAILMHDTAPKWPLSRYAVMQIAKYWLEDGNKVIAVCGDKNYVPADIAIVHVDLSVVPDSYLELANKYPIALNKHVKDIRKSTVSDNLLRKNDNYSGKVIVKSDLNFAGWPERFATGTLRSQQPVSFKLPTDYKIFNQLSDVPEEYFEQKDMVLEKFMPEKEGELYFIRNFLFLGDKNACYRAASYDPVCNSASLLSLEITEPHREVFEWRESLKFDYGKFDYVVYKGKPVLLDANKTAGAMKSSPNMEQILRERSRGIYSYL